MSGNVSVLNVTLNFVVMDLNPMITSAHNQLKRESESTYVFLSFHCSIKFVLLKFHYCH